MASPPARRPSLHSLHEGLLRQRVSALRRALPGARAGDPASIHQSRVATRRLREALPLLDAGKPGRRLESAVRDLTRALGPVRELDVALEMLDELSSQSDIPSGAVKCLRNSVADERRRMHREMVRRLGDWDFQKLQRKAAAALVDDDRPRPPARDARQEQQAAARRRAARRAVRLQAAIDTAASFYVPERLHDVRIAVKKLRYALEVVRDLSASGHDTARSSTDRSRRTRAQARILTLKRMQELLGRLHDLEVLVARTRAIQASAAVPDLRLSGELDTLVRHLETEGRQLHAQYTGARRALTDICDRVIAAAERKAA